MENINSLTQRASQRKGKNKLETHNVNVAMHLYYKATENTEQLKNHKILDLQI